mmetsp:Transcript_153477/g.490629  ORF Transcript_153477/g.490629 Transcript_153477/m.490629 type:complete len:219 (+) Transcript_153477:2089-2745(+)
MPRHCNVYGLASDFIVSQDRWDLFVQPTQPCGFEFTEFSDSVKFGGDPNGGRSYANYAKCLAAVFLPKTPGQILFWDLYAIGLPMFVPDPHALLPLYFAKTEPGWVTNKWATDPLGAQKPDFATHQPYEVHRWDAWRAKTLLMDYATAPHVQTFRNVGHLLRKLCATTLAEFRAVSRAMQRSHKRHIELAATFWRQALATALDPDAAGQDALSGGFGG